MSDASGRATDTKKSRWAATLGMALLAAAGLLQAGVASAGACPVTLPQGSEPVTLDPADFVDRIDNPFVPFLPGSRWVYRETDAEGARPRVTVTVTDRTRPIGGIAATVRSAGMTLPNPVWVNRSREMDEPARRSTSRSPHTALP